jgi:hypothetical protein
VVTNPGFDKQARIMSREAGIPSLQVAVYPDPFDLETDAQLQEKSVKILVPQIIDALTKPISAATVDAKKRDSTAVVFAVSCSVLASLLFGRRITDLHSGMRAYRRSMINEMHYEMRGTALPVELLLRPLRLHKRVKVVFISYHERLGTSTMQPLQSAWFTLKRILRARFT